MQSAPLRRFGEDSMVFFNYATMQMAAKIVYYGPGLCGKTTNLHVIYGRTAPTSRGEMVCLETETDRTLFFDLLPLDVGVIGGFKTRLQLYTVPGQVFYNTTRKLVLKGVDGIVFVADSQRPMRDPNVESLKNLRENLAEIGLTLETVPRVFQYNKRDLPNILSLDELNESLNPDGSVEFHEASATNGTGVFETLKAISKLTLRSLKGRMTVEQRRPTVVVSGETPAPIPAAALHARPPGARVSGITAAIESLGEADAAPATPPPETNAFDSTISRLQRLQSLHRQGVDLHAASAAGTGLAALTPPATAMPAGAGPQEAPFEAANLPPADDPGGEVSFAEIQPPPDEPPPDSSVKHVRVRSNVDILSELEKLRKIATQKPASPSLKVEERRGRLARRPPRLHAQPQEGRRAEFRGPRPPGRAREEPARERRAVLRRRLRRLDRTRKALRRRARGRQGPAEAPPLAQIQRPRRMKTARLLAALGAFAAAGCASAPAGDRAAAPAAPSPDAAALAARAQATDLFYRGKAFALAGDGACAREAFQEALETFRAAARPGNGSDLAFAGELWDSVGVYRPAVDDGRARAPSRSARPPRTRATASSPPRRPRARTSSRRRRRRSPRSPPESPSTSRSS